MAVCFAGIDVSLKTLVTFLILPTGQSSEFSVENNTMGHKELARRLTLKGRQAVVVLEATSTYGLDLALHLSRQPRCQVSVLNPRAARDFARATMQRGKTDPLDARSLARYAQAIQPEPWKAPSNAALQLRRLSRRITELVDLKTAQSNRSHATRASLALAALADSNQRMLSHIEAEIQLVEAAAMTLIQEDPALRRRFELLVSARGIAKRSALCILGELACLPPDMDKRQWVAMAGLDPCPRQSGTSLDGKRSISRQGSSFLRRALFMPMMVATNKDRHGQSTGLGIFYHRLVESEKPKRVAQCAAMRKFLHAIWGMFKNDTPFDPTKFNPRGLD